MSEEENVNEDDVIKVLIATDNHLGCHEKNPIRGNDSFVTFDEILQIASDRKADFVLLGGDLFHENKPNPSVFHRCMRTLRYHCFGDRPVAIEFMSDPDIFEIGLVNYEDPNVNVQLPVFSIHGNHDDPSGERRTSALDLLSSMGLVNYFGRCNDLTEIKIFPILLQKGATKLALYGLSHIKDERLSRLFKDHKVTMARPNESPEEWFNIFVLHQNHAENRGHKNYIPEAALPEFLDFVVWGHEHDHQDVTKYLDHFYVSQPGSSVATSLAMGESLDKHVVMLKIHKKNFQYEKIRLRTVRPFIFEDYVLPDPKDCDYNHDDPSDQAQELVKNKINEMLRKAKTKETGHPKQPMLPLLRLVVYYLDERQYFSPIRFGQNYTERVANPSDMVVMKLHRLEKKKKSDILLQDLDEAAAFDGMPDIIERILGEDHTATKVLPTSVLNEALMRYVDSSHRDAFELVFNQQTKKAMEKILQMDNVNEGNVKALVNRLRTSRSGREAQEVAEASRLLDNTAPKTEPPESETETIELSDDDEPEPALETPTRRGRGRRPPATRSRGRARASGRGRGRYGALDSFIE